MAVSPPTPDQLKAIADEMGLALTESDIGSFLALMKPSLDGYNVVDALPDNLPPVRYPRTPGVRPQPDENPRNAWYVKARVEGAPSGKLKGKTIVLKDNVMLAGVPMMNGASTLEGYTPEIDATIVTASSTPAAPSPVRPTASTTACPAAATPTPPAPSTTPTRWATRPAAPPRAAPCWSRWARSTWPSAATKAAPSAYPPRSAGSTA